MERILDLLALATAALTELATRVPVAFLGILGLALLSAALSWTLLAHSALLWNRRFAAKARRHPLCALAALSTLVALPLSLGPSYIRPFVDQSIRRWAREALADPRWQEGAFDQARERIHRGGLEPLLPPREAGFLPLTTPAAREAAAGAYSAAAVESFSRAHRRLASLLDLSAAAPAKALSADMQESFTSYPGLYPTSRMAQILAGSLSETADRYWERIAKRMQIYTLLLLLLLHLAAFGIVGWAGFRDIRAGRGEGGP